jgi:autoinducer 2 (AI-2) kinase
MAQRTADDRGIYLEDAMKYLLTLDAGTGSGRAVLFDFVGNAISSAAREWLAPTLPEYPGSAVFDTARAWELLCECIREVMSRSQVRATDIAAVTATSMREGFVLYDHDKREIWACPNIDARAGEQAAALMRNRVDEEIYDTAGDGLAITMPPRLLWIAQCEPGIWARARHLSMISDWILFRLSGEIATDPSCGSSSGLFDLHTGQWSQRLLRKLDLPAIFPPVMAPGTMIGQTTAKAAADTGLAVHTPVVMGGADTQLALLGSAGQATSPLTVVGGTFWQTALLTDKPLRDPERRLRTLCYVQPGRWMTEGIGFLNGLALRWVRDTLCHDLAVRAARDNTDAYSLMEELAQAAPAGADGIQALVSDVMNARRWVQAPTTFLGIDSTNPGHCGAQGRGRLIRATQESAAFTARCHWDILHELSGARPASLTFCGGAAKGTLWPQIMADTFGLPVRLPKVKETTCLGAACCALVGAKEYQTLEEAAAALARWDRVVEPIPSHVARYEELWAQHAALQANLMDLVKQGKLRALWSAPGVEPCHADK